MEKAQNKIKSRDEVAKLVEVYKKQGKIIGFTSGVFDILHRGHISYLEQAACECDLLVIAVNSDESVKINKPGRPFVTANDRALLIAGLSASGLVFIFDEKNNNVNIEVIRPNIYFKAGDYRRETLTSAPIIEKYGGKVSLLKLEEGFSTTNIVNKIADASNFPQTTSPIKKISRPAIFLDRDGTIIEHIEYIHEAEKVQLISGAATALKHLKNAGYSLIVITNQPGIGLGYFTKEDFFKTNSEMLKQLRQEGVTLDGVYYSPDHEGIADSTSRKPATGLVELAVKANSLILEKSFMIGDMTVDLKLAQNLDIPGILVRTGKAGEDKRYKEALPAYVAQDLSDATNFILHRK
jgi:D-glycero-D-manno-heptose 1,7-bisphosphate phosphatase